MSQPPVNVGVPQRLAPELERRVLAFWAEELGVDVGALDRDGLVVVSDPRDFAAARRATIRTARGTLLLAAPVEADGAATEAGAYAADVAAHPRGIGLLHYRATAPNGDQDPRIGVLSGADRALLDEVETAVDVGVLVHPVARRRGLGAAVVADVTRRAVSSGRLVQYRCNDENEASAPLARSCGFALWGVLTVASLP